MNTVKKDLIYKPCRILYYNSCTYTFFETYLDKDTLLLGNNNTGKTSFLNGLQLFLLPETTFKKAHSKFNFKDHKQEDSYKFYFPSNNSFIIAEFENPHGKFVQVLFRGKDTFEYSRIFTKESYDTIRDMLWDSEKENPEVKEVNGSEFKDFLKRSKDAKLVNKNEDLITLMYSNSINDEDKGRFSLIPLNLEGFKFETMKNIIKLAFNIDLIDNEDLKDIFINVIESNYVNKKDSSNYDLLGLCDEQGRYKDEMDRYIVIENHRDIFEECDQDIETLTRLAPQIKTDYTQYVSFYNKEYESITADIDKRKNSLNFFKSKIEPLKESIKIANNHKIENESKTKLLNEQIGKDKIKFDAYTKVISQYSSFDDAFEKINARIAEINENLKLISDKEKLNTEITTLTRSILELKKNNKDIEMSRTDKTDPEKICNQFPENIKDFYNSYFKVGILTKKKVLTETELESLVSFHDLVTYHEEDRKYYIFGESVCAKESSLNIEELNKQYDKNTQLITEKEIALEEKKILRNDEVTKNKANLEAELKKITDNKVTLTSFSMIEDTIKAKEVEVFDLKAELLVLEKRLETNNKELISYETQAAEHDRNIEDKLVRKTNLVDNYKSIINSAKTIGFNESSVNLDDNIKLTITNLTKEMVDDFEKSIEDSIKLKVRIKQNLSRFVDIRLAQDEHKILIKDDCSAQEMKTIFFNDIKPHYEHLDNNKENLKNRMKNGFVKAHSDSQMINDQKKQIELTIANINHKLEKIKVSNFDKVCITIETDPKFDEFTTAFVNTDVYNPTDEAIDNFFFRLRGLLAKLDIKTKIKIEDILKKVNIVYDKGGVIESKSQSNGTIVTTNAMILSVLKEELIAHKESKFIKYQYFLPIIIDEVAKIDNVNLRNLHSFLKECHFIMFCATPTPTISTDNHYDITISLSNHIKSKIFHEDRKIVHCLPNPVKLISIDSTIEAEGDLLSDEDIQNVE